MNFQARIVIQKYKFTCFGSRNKFSVKLKIRGLAAPKQIPSFFSQFTLYQYAELTGIWKDFINP